ncbi:MAG TPA: class I SAM-dependent methyltransferase [Gaiellaceae bacterium]|nr:class I SAM-dependent methyltransferase [Gaiellaceae bacterium]
MNRMLRRRLRPLLGLWRWCASFLPARPRGPFAPDVASGLTEPEAVLLAELAAGKVALELGSWYGRSTIALASAAVRVHAVDAHGGDAHTGPLRTLDAFLRNLSRYGVRDRVVVHVGRIEDVAPVLAPASVDVVFVDGLHTRAAVERDAGLLLPLVRPGGTIAFHDYGRYDVTAVVDGLGEPERVVDSIAVLRVDAIRA